MKRIATSIILASCAIPLLLNCGETVLGGGYPGTGGQRTTTTTSMTTTSGAVGNACGATPVAFAPPATYPVYGDAIAIAAGDLNGDGVPDLAVLTNGVNEVSLLLNHGDGTFAPPFDYPTPWNPKAIVAAPLLGGHAADLVIMENSGVPNGSLGVIPNNGDGTFAPPVVVPLGEQPTALAVADLDGDGKPDILVTLIGDECGNCGGGSGAWPKTNELGWLRNNGDGTFAPLVTYPTGTGPAGVTAADVNGDGRTDVIVTNQIDDTVSVLINMGGGVLAPRVDYPTGYGPSVVAAADLNGDGRADLAVINWYTSFLENPGPTVPQTVSVLLAKEGGGFAPKVDYVTDRDPVSLAVADLNGDGKPDLAVAHNDSQTVGVFLGRGDGTFDAKIDWNGGGELDANSDTKGIVAADLNGDGRPDLAIANNFTTLFGGGGQGGGGSAIPLAVTVLLNACHESGGGAGGAGTTAGGGGAGGCVPGTGGSGCYGGGCVLASTTPVESNPIGTQGDWLETFDLAGSAYTCSPGNAGELTLAQCEMLCPPSVTMQPLQQCAVVVGGPIGGQVECRYSDCGSPCAFH